MTPKKKATALTNEDIQELRDLRLYTLLDKLYRARNEEEVEKVCLLLGYELSR